MKFIFILAHVFLYRWLLVPYFIVKNVGKMLQQRFSDQTDHCMILQHLLWCVQYLGLLEFLQNPSYQLIDYLVHGIADIRGLKGSPQQDTNRNHPYQRWGFSWLKKKIKENFISCLLSSISCHRWLFPNLGKKQYFKATAGVLYLLCNFMGISICGWGIQRFKHKKKKKKICFPHGYASSCHCFS